MNITFLGACGVVTGSCYLINIDNKNILLDCGIYQGKDSDEIKNSSFEFNPQDIDYLILSHAHIDHSGKIPLLYKKGFRGKIICTKSTKDLCSVMLPDSAHIIEYETKWKNKSRKKKNLPEIEPLYDVETAKKTLPLFEGHEYNENITLFSGFEITLLDSGHLLGAAIIKIHINKDKDKFDFVFSGDIGNINIPILKDPTKINFSDYIMIETTYGSKDHKNPRDELKKLARIITDTFKKGGNVIIPSFAVGRTQQVIYTLNNYVEKNIFKNIKVYIDSPLSSECTEIFQKYEKDYDKEAKDLLKKGDNPLDFHGLFFTKSKEESIALKDIEKGAVIISSSGMCDAGRIKHHLLNNLSRSECSVVFVGYQAEGTLGKRILDGDKKVKIFGKEIEVNSSIYNLQSLSCHADKKGLLSWIKNFNPKPKKIILVHGEESSRESFKNALEKEGFKVICPKLGEKLSL